VALPYVTGHTSTSTSTTFTFDLLPHYHHHHQHHHHHHHHHHHQIVFGICIHMFGTFISSLLISQFVMLEPGFLQRRLQLLLLFHFCHGQAEDLVINLVKQTM